ncbi:hypothetical protein O166_02010 [Pseudogulbenkiania ferrooxidans EGD-HP2]|uniref:Transposase n=1 Tax=Pseudogulbenkiania ferrooxidans EGD-HP2 TaxID=1388764 RepID=A0ABP2XHB6_9NEIS|nr:hypothetical protein O166_02010 [Pseudogulbenkiania ferrooxidans EGD-HP2]
MSEKAQRDSLRFFRFRTILMHENERFFSLKNIYPDCLI